MILLVENDQALVAQLTAVLSVFKTPIVTAHTLAQAEELLCEHTPEVMILDRILDDGDGLELAQIVHNDALPTRVLILSSLGTLQERLRGLEQGVDDYLPKPFSLSELVLKVKTLLYRRKENPTKTLTLGPMSISPETGELTLGKIHTKLRKREMEIFASLVRYKNQVLSRDKLIDLVWGQADDLPTHATLDVYIRRIRMALGGDSECIETVRGFGYRALER